MASRLILQKKRSLLNALGQPTRTRFILGFSSLGHGQPSESSDLDGLSRFPCYPSATTEHRLERNLFHVNKDDIAACATSKFLLHSSSRVSTFGFRIEKIDFSSLTRSRLVSQCTRHISMAPADQPGLGSGNERNEQSADKQKKEASPEECDEAVEGLSTVKAQAKAKLQESHKSDESIIKRLWAKILGIGPAFRAILSMSRFKIYCFLFCVI